MSLSACPIEPPRGRPRRSAGRGPSAQRAIAVAYVTAIFMTAIDDDATRNEAMKAGCVAYLKKPFAPQLLLDAIAKAA